MISLKNNKQHGSTLVEFSIVASLFFLLIFAIIEFGRLLFTWHALNETSRRTARLATVCQVSATEQQDTLLAAIIDNVPLPGFTINNIEVNYLDSLGQTITEDVTQTVNFNQIEFVEARITNYQISLLIPLFDLTFTAPDFRTLLPRESLGVTRTGFTDC
ncbi:TadE/TadG family type IV pilus assembly protein (plasmid) [Photobacterium sp. DA100]|uniref:TadE/TadG family type IV pilus assembly protein n=1 Tax=Photobacterium sp. DA100 TaxID=3027472 RepID=UPI00247A23AC|nr:TadE/TadG family type IV pilus assembly protein [Photobacterium sp. DA100]WEM45898.1 TadE/TadG family type IV pilus assembly protein [Photobacterium sp. DA100]